MGLACINGRRVRPELLDEITDDRSAPSLRDLVRINRLFGGHRIARALFRGMEPPTAPFTILDVGAASGDMGRASYVLVGRPGAMSDSFGSSCHGAGRVMSRGAATRAARGRSIRKELLEAGVYARAHSRKGLDEEQPDAYKDVSRVVEVVHNAGLTKIVAKLRPVGVVKG